MKAQSQQLATLNRTRWIASNSSHTPGMCDRFDANSDDKDMLREIQLKKSAFVWKVARERRQRVPPFRRRIGLHPLSAQHVWLFQVPKTCSRDVGDMVSIVSIPVGAVESTHFNIGESGTEERCLIFPKNVYSMEKIRIGFISIWCISTLRRTPKGFTLALEQRMMRLLTVRAHADAPILNILCRLR